MHERAGKAAIAATASGKRSVRSKPFRVISFTPPALSLGQDAEAVVLDFVDPAGSGRRHFGGSWQTGLVAPDLPLQLTRYTHAG